MLNKFPFILPAVTLKMYICCCYRFVELIPSGNKLWHGDWSFRWVFNLSSKIYDRVGNLLWFFLLKVVGADVQNDLIWRKLQVRFTIIPPGGGGDSHLKGAGMLVVSLRGVYFRFWSRLGCSGQNTIIFSRKGLFYGCARRDIKKIIYFQFVLFTRFM